jgi:hypothetical protein
MMCVAAMWACDGYSSGPDDDGSLTGGFYGTVEGTEKGNPFSRTVNLQLNEYASTVTGGFSFVGGYGAGDISGSVTGSSVTFTFAQTIPCAGTFTGSGMFAEDRLTGTYSGSSCRGAVTASFELDRVPPAVPL